MKNAVTRSSTKVFALLTVCSFTFFIDAQSQNSTDTTRSLSLGQCIDYALKNQPALQQSLINIDITRSTNKISLAGWLPQAYLNANFTHYLTLPTAVVDTTGGRQAKEHTGITNTIVPAFTVTQTIFSPVLLYAAKSAPLYVKQAEQITDSTKIFLVSQVSKAYYNLLQTLEQIDVLREDTARLNKNLSDTYHQYVAGTVDETDYDEAAISLNNSKAQLKQATESVIPQYAMLKQVMGFPAREQFNVSFDTLQMMRDIEFDTTQQLQYDRRIEYQQLQTAKILQHQVTNYYRNAFLPNLSAVFNYTPEFESNPFPQLFSNAYPYSYIGLSLSLPIFTGFARLENVHKSRLQEHLLDWDEVNLKAQIFVDYTSAMANYKSNLYNYEVMKDNEEKAKRVYGIVQLQYLQGIVAYLNVITAESNLITSEIGYVIALFQLLSSKIDLEKAMGIITYNR
ncbi:MAG TPA: TolC family protein [Puia sp.]|nr:TolC family protein [Puia sp.]